MPSWTVAISFRRRNFARRKNWASVFMAGAAAWIRSVRSHRRLGHPDRRMKSWRIATGCGVTYHDPAPGSFRQVFLAPVRGDFRQPRGCCAHRRRMPASMAWACTAIAARPLDEDAYSHGAFRDAAGGIFCRTAAGISRASGSPTASTSTDQRDRMARLPADRRRALSPCEHASGQRHLPGERPPRGGREGGHRRGRQRVQRLRPCV